MGQVALYVRRVARRCCSSQINFATRLVFVLGVSIANDPVLGGWTSSLLGPHHPYPEEGFRGMVIFCERFPSFAGKPKSLAGVGKCCYEMCFELQTFQFFPIISSISSIDFPAVSLTMMPSLYRMSG